jgi:hypothetical protein
MSMLDDDPPLLLHDLTIPPIGYAKVLRTADGDVVIITLESGWTREKVLEAIESAINVLAG